MLDLIVYDRIEEKNIIEARSFKRLTGQEALVQTLNLMDFMAALKRQKADGDDSIDWIVLKIGNDNK
jgi:hypothetical protein